MQSLEQQALVSVVIASYNMGQYLSQAVTSVCASTYTNIEIIIIDDGSSDNTKELIQSCLSDERVKYIYQENQGQPKAKNHGMRVAQGEFIAFCDADDLWEPNKLELQIPLFSDPKVGVVYTDTSNIDENNKRYNVKSPYQRYSGKVTDQLLITNFVPFGTAVIRRECIEQGGPFDEQFRMGIDWDLWLRLSLDWEFLYISDQTYIYRTWSGQMSTNYRGRYEHTFAILKNFDKKFGHKINRRVIRKAWADNYINKADIFSINEKIIIQPLRDAMFGVFLDPFNPVGWKCVVKVILRWCSLMPKRE